MTNTLSISDDKKWTMEEVQVPCKMIRTLVMPLQAGTEDFFTINKVHYERERTTTRSFLSETNTVSTVFEYAIKNSLQASLPLPIKIIKADIGSEVSTRMELALNKSTTIEESYEKDTEVGFEIYEGKTYNAVDNRDDVVYKEKMLYGSTEVSCEMLRVSKDEWDNMEKSKTFKSIVQIPVDFYWFNLQTDEGHNLHIHMNNVKSDLPLIVYTPKETAAQLWRWDGNRLCSRHQSESGENYYVKVAGRSSRPNKNVGVWKGKVENNLAEEWEGSNGKDRENAIKNGHGWFLSVKKGSGKNADRNGKGVIVWNEFNNNPWQRWNFVHQPRKMPGK